MDNFKFEVPDVGKLFKVSCAVIFGLIWISYIHCAHRQLRVGHDNKGLGAAWHLDRIELRCLATETFYTFVAQRWLATSEGDRQTVIELPVTSCEVVDKHGRRVAGTVDPKARSVTYKVFLSLFLLSSGGGGDRHGPG